MSSNASDLAVAEVTADGRVVIPAHVVEAARLAPGACLVFEVSHEEVFVRSEAVALAEDEADLAAIRAAEAGPGERRGVGRA